MKDFISKLKYKQSLTIIAAGLYPFLHYYNGNYTLADSWQQLLYLILISFAIPQIIDIVRRILIKFKLFEFIKLQSLSILNVVVFYTLMSYLVFRLNLIHFLCGVLIAIFIGYLTNKHLKKVVLIQFILAVMSLFSLIPKLYFDYQFNNTSWCLLSQNELNTEFIEKPNIFLIQPDGYVNFSEIDKKPYSFNNGVFKEFLETNGFTNYMNFRSNYFTTLTSNASLFSMKHHYYNNTRSSNLKTYSANEINVGDKNNVLKILKKNRYTTHFITDNSYMLINRVPLYYDFTNVKQFSFHYPGNINDINIAVDLKMVLDTIRSKNNFFFIEKTIPGHISTTKRSSEGKVLERLKYLKKISKTNIWLKNLINIINTYDKNALIIIAADHGGFVGFDYTRQTITQKLNLQESKSAFSSILSIKWPSKVNYQNIKFHSSVNLFRKVFFALSNNDALIENINENGSFMPLKNNGSVNFYQYIDSEGSYNFKSIFLNKKN